jgi:hypothetical protein
MKELPIFFNTAMVESILAGKKGATRRVVPKWQVPQRQNNDSDDARYNWMAIAQRDSRYGFGCFGESELACVEEMQMFAPCPFGSKGDRLWVREAFIPDPPSNHSAWDSSKVSYFEWSGCGSKVNAVPAELQTPDFAIYRAGWSGGDLAWRPSIHMPRWACRIILEITGKRLERLQSISDKDIESEGVYSFPLPRPFPKAGVQVWPGYEAGGRSYLDTALDSFASLWRSTGGDWDSNPWVWVIEFKVLTTNGVIGKVAI